MEQYLLARIKDRLSKQADVEQNLAFNKINRDREIVIIVLEMSLNIITIDDR